MESNLSRGVVQSRIDKDEQELTSPSIGSDEKAAITCDLQSLNNNLAQLNAQIAALPSEIGVPTSVNVWVQ